MGSYSNKAQPYLDVIARAVFEDSEVRHQLLEGTKFSEQYAGAEVLLTEQQKVRWRKKSMKQPFWANYHCGMDSRCLCRIPGSSSLESDAIFYLRSVRSEVLAIHVEFKHTDETFRYGQPEGYPLRAACFAKSWRERAYLNPHQDWMTLLFCGEEALRDERIGCFQRVITHREAQKFIDGYPGSECVTRG